MRYDYNARIEILIMLNDSIWDYLGEISMLNMTGKKQCSLKWTKKNFNLNTLEINILIILLVHKVAF